MKRFLIAATAFAIGATAVMAQSDPIATRKATMKAVGGAFYGDMGKMNKGEAPFDKAKVMEDLRKITDSAKTLPALYPDNSKTGGETAALPKIWEAKADFDARYTKLSQEADAAMSKITDEASFKANYTELNKNCSGCHELYRAKKS
jgi:cytochrome c556